MAIHDPTPATLRRQRWTLLVTDLRADLSTVLTFAAQHPDNIPLSGLAVLARRYSAELRGACASPDLSPGIGHNFNDFGRWGENGHAPAIRDLAESARFHAARAAEAMEAAA